MQISSLTPDEQMRKAVFAALATDEHTARASLRVGVLNGIAHLAGEVGSMAIRAAAEEIARQIPGVRGVVNRIEAPGAPSPARKIDLNLNSSDQLYERIRSTLDDKSPQ